MKRRIFLEHLLVAGTVTGAVVVQAGEGVRTPASSPVPLAAGQRVTLTGRVITAKREPVTDAGVTIWQACVNGLSGRVDETRREDWTATDDQGRYLFHTTLPGACLMTERSDPGLGLVSIRAPHIGFSVSRTGHEPFTSQIFFDLFDDINKFDLDLYEKSQEEQRLLIAHVEPAGTDTSALCRFDIVV